VRRSCPRGTTDVTCPMLLAHEARTAAILEGMNDHIPGMPRDLPDMMRDLAFRRTLVNSQTALALISTHPDEPAGDMVSLARHAIARCRGGEEDRGDELPSLPAGITAEELLVAYRRVLAIMLEGANECRPPGIETFGDILSHARIPKRYLGPSRRCASSSAADACPVRRSHGSRSMRRRTREHVRRTDGRAPPWDCRCQTGSRRSRIPSDRSRRQLGPAEDADQSVKGGPIPGRRGGAKSGHWQRAA
jgi:hypothetical protein